MLFKNSLSFLSRVIKNAPFTLLLVMALSPAVRASVNAVEHINYIENKMNYLITADQFILAWNKVKTIGIDFEAELDQISSFDPCSTNCSLEMTTQGATHYKIYDDLVDIRYVAYYNVDKGELLGVGQYISTADINDLTVCTITACGWERYIQGSAAYYTFYPLKSGGYLLAYYDSEGNLLHTEEKLSNEGVLSIDNGADTSATVDQTILHDAPSYLQSWEEPYTTSDASLVARLEGEYGVSPTGQSYYRVPLKVPHGLIDGFAPRLSANYSSSASKDLLGPSWSLGGVSKIYRCTSTFHQVEKVVGTGNGGDKFCVDGQQLLQTTSNADYFAVGNQYHTAIDNLTRYELKSGDYIEARTKSGLIIVYGRSAGSSISNNDIKTLYMIDDVYHQSVGGLSASDYQKIDYQYTISANYPHVSNISYAGASIDFSYTDAIVNNSIVLGAYRGTISKRLSAIVTSLNGVYAKRYKFKYAFASSSFGYFLRSIQECGFENNSDEHCGEPLVMEWEYESSSKAKPLFTPTNTFNFSPHNFDNNIKTIIPVNLDQDEMLEFIVSNNNQVQTYDRSGYDYGGVVSVEDDIPPGAFVSSPIVTDTNRDGIAEVYFTVAVGNGKEFHQRIKDPSDPGGGCASRIVTGGATITINGVTRSLGGSQTYLFQGEQIRGETLNCVYLRSGSDPQGVYATNGTIRANVRIGSNHLVRPAPDQPTFTTRVTFEENLSHELRKWDESRERSSIVHRYAHYTGTSGSYLNIAENYFSNLEAQDFVPVVVADKNADTVTDLFYPEYTRLTADTTDPKVYKARKFKGTSIYSRFEVIDYNLDGKDDALVIGSAGQLMVYPSITGGGISLGTLSSRMNRYNTFLLDVNRDGLQDLHFSNGGKVAYFLGKVGGFERRLYQTEISAASLFKHVPSSAGTMKRKKQLFKVADINKDGHPDLIFPEGDTFVAWLSNGVTWSEKINLNLPVELGSRDGVFAVADVNVDGHLDIVQSKGKSVTVATGSSGLRGYLRSIEDGFGKVVSFTHGVIGPQENSTDKQPLRWPVKGSYFATKTMTVDTSAGKKNTYSYKYSNSYVDGGGLGMLPFQEISVTNSAWSGNYIKDARVEKTYYNQGYPLTGRPIHKEVSYLTRGPFNRWGEPATKISETEYDYVVNESYLSSNLSAFNKVLRPYTSHQRQLSYDKADDASAATVVSVTDVATGYYNDANNPAYLGNMRYRSTTVAGGVNHAGDLTGVVRTVIESHVSYSNDEDDWLIGFATQREVTSTQAGESRTIKTKLEPKAGTLLLEKQTDHYQDPRLQRETTHHYTANGVLEKTELEGFNPDYPNAKHTVYEVTEFEASRYPKVVKNALGHEMKRQIDLRFGSPTQEEDANGHTQTTEYDALGRAVEVSDSTTSVVYKTEYSKGSSTGYEVTKTAKAEGLGLSVQPMVVQYFDALGRVVREESENFDASGLNKVVTTYNAQGNVIRVSEPYSGARSIYDTVFNEYDRLNRLKLKTNPDGGTVSFDYAPNADGSGGRTITTTHTVKGKQLGGSAKPETTQRNIKVENALGQLVSVTDALDTETVYQYDPLGNLKYTQIAGNAATEVTAVYDNAGNKLSMTDPDTGSYTYQYDALGNLRKQTDAKDQEIAMQYDLLNRLIQRTDGSDLNAAVSTWVYDTATYGVGLLHCVADTAISDCGQDHQNYKELYSYDDKSRPMSVATLMRVNGESRGYSANTRYDAQGRVDVVTYPSGFQVQNIYKAETGHLEKQVDPGNTGKVYRQTTSVNNRDQITGFNYGNGFKTGQQYNSKNGRLSLVYSYKPSNRTGVPNSYVQYSAYHFDTLGNLDYRTINSNVTGHALEEGFSYDALNRLSSTQLNDGAVNNYTYSILGNLEAKPGVAGALSYHNGSDGAGVHAVKTANGLSYRYDDNGNMNEVRDGNNDVVRSIGYSIFNKPIRIAANGAVNTFKYSPERSRYYQSLTDEDGTTTQTFYAMGGAFEEVVENGVSTQKTYVGDFLLHTQVGSTEEIQYLHRDHLGSIEAITNEDGTIAQHLSFEAFGARRDGSDWVGAADANVTDNTTRGFTDHEHLDAVGLIHMNGRVYDPVLGRFLSPDIVIQFPAFSQSYNRYSYVLNNPLGFVDPSGYLGVALDDEYLSGVTGHPGGIDFSFALEPIPLSTGANIDVGSAGEVFTMSGDEGVQVVATQVEAWAVLGESPPVNSSGVTLQQGAETIGQGASAVGDFIEPSWVDLIPGGKALGVLFGISKAAKLTSHGFKYDPRIRAKSVKEGGGHLFPYSFDDAILKTNGVKLPRGGATGYALRGRQNGREVVYNMIVDNGVITHRDYVSARKWPQRNKSFGFGLNIDDLERID